MTESVQRGVSSVEVAGAILQILRRSASPMSLRDLAALSGLSSSRLHHYLVSLVRVGLVYGDSGRYALGSFAMELGLVAADNLELQHASARWLHKLSIATRQSCFFAVGSPRGALIVRWEQGSKPLTVHARLGTVMPILTSATGLVWLAKDPQASNATFESELRRIAPAQRRRARQARLDEAETVRRQGIATARGSMIANVHALACPVITKKSQFAGILTVLGIGGDFDANSKGGIAKQLRQCALLFGQRVA